MFVKRAFDIVLSASLLVVLSPLLITVIYLVRRDGSSAIYRHWRIGEGGNEFPCLKFRTMASDSDEVLATLLADPVFKEQWQKDRKLRADPRVTELGLFLRRTSIDELPQLLNVLLGDMSIVGPRPITRDELSRYGDNAQWYLKMKPGMTGLWQVSGRNSVDYETRVSLDVRYVQHWSIWKDIVILLKTPPALLKGM